MTEAVKWYPGELDCISFAMDFIIISKKNH